MTPDGNDAPRDRIFDALADPTRRRIVEEMASVPEATITQIAGRFPITRQAVTRHLAVLEEAGVVTIESRGRERVVSLRPGTLRSASSWLDAIGKEWDTRLSALRAHLEQNPGDSA